VPLKNEVTMLPNYTVLDANLEFQPEDAIRSLQSERLSLQVHQCYQSSSFWRRKFDGMGLTPEDIGGLSDLHKIPFCTKAELLEDQGKYPPFGSYLSVHPSRLAKYFTTSGTTGRPLTRVYSDRDWTYIRQRFQRKPFLKHGDTAVLLGPTDGLLGPTAAVDSWEAMGALVIRAARNSTEEKIRIIHRLKPKLVCGTASFLLYLAEKARNEDMPFHRMGGVGILLSVGEPGAAIPATRERLLKGWSAQTVIDGFGITELFPMGGSCPGCRDTHISNDFVIVEVVDPETGEILPPGMPGELVYTNIIGETQPLLRYRSRDIGRIAPFAPCPACGSTATRIVGGIQGRVDEMIWYKGINIFPSSVEAVVRGFREFTDEFEIVLRQDGEVQTLLVRAEAVSGLSTEEREGLRERVSQRLVEALEGVHAGVEILDEGTLQRTEYKGRRVRDLRPG
jgi:phenylacetate-CoA ligase